MRLHRKGPDVILSSLVAMVYQSTRNFTLCSLYSSRYCTRVLGATCPVCNVLHGWSRGQKKEQHAAADYLGPVKIEL